MLKGYAFQEVISNEIKFQMILKYIGDHEALMKQAMLPPGHAFCICRHSSDDVLLPLATCPSPYLSKALSDPTINIHIHGEQKLTQ